jgi:ArsR family transcriptional regulator
MERELNSNFILDILGNETRRNILSTLADEPMYFNQLAREIRIGQQSILRHMQALEDGGLVKTYQEKSDLGAPDRKYYYLSSTFNLNISMSQDSFSITTNDRLIQKKDLDKKNDNSNYADKNKRIFYKSSGQVIKGSVDSEVSSVRKTLASLESEISDLELRLNNLRALKQTILHRLHKIGKDNFEHLERRILYRTITTKSTISASRLADVLNENESNVRGAISGLRDKLDKNTIRMLFS